MFSVNWYEWQGLDGGGGGLDVITHQELILSVILINNCARRTWSSDLRMIFTALGYIFSFVAEAKETTSPGCPDHTRTFQKIQNMLESNGVNFAHCDGNGRNRRASPYCFFDAENIPCGWNYSGKRGTEFLALVKGLKHNFIDHNCDDYFRKALSQFQIG